MPLPNEKIDVHKSFVSGWLEIGTQTPKYNENRRLIGTVFKSLYRTRYQRASLTNTDQLLLGGSFTTIKQKVSIPYNVQIENYVENKLVVKKGDTIYNIVSTDKYQKDLFLYLSTADDKGGKVYLDN